jgi:hypothetical protein
VMARMVSTTPFLPGALCRFRRSSEPSRSRYQPAAISLPPLKIQTLGAISPNNLGQCGDGGIARKRRESVKALIILAAAAVGWLITLRWWHHAG